MKNKSMAAVLMAAAALSFTGCGERTDIPDETIIARESGERTGCVEGCTCTGCICCGTAYPEESTVLETAAEESAQEESQSTAENIEGSGPEQTEPQPEQPAPEETRTVAGLSEGELKARREQQRNFDEARQLLYSLPDSKDKTSKINQMDRQILANNAYDFSKKNIVFIGDSITEGIASAVDVKGNYISYVNYADSHLHFNRVLNHGLGGRMFSDCGGEELSLAMNFGNVTNIDADIIVVFAGLNDYLCTPESKQFGDVYDKMSTGGYCGSVRSFMKQLKQYYGNRDIFFVTMYGVSAKVNCTYSDIAGQPELNDYMDVQRKLADEFGFHVIELYNTGFMDCSDKESSEFYLRDGLHPKDNGNIALGEHIAAELSLCFGEKEVD